MEKKSIYYTAIITGWLAVMIILMLCCTSCSRHSAPQSSAIETVHDTTILERTLRDTMVTIEADSSMLRALIECDSVGQAHLKELISYRSGKHIGIPNITIQDNIITAKLTQKELEYKIQVLEQMLKTKQYKQQVVTKTEYVNKLTRWQKMRLTIANMVLAVVALSIAVQLYKHFRR